MGLCQDPQIVAVPGFLAASLVALLLDLPATTVPTNRTGPFTGCAETLRTLEQNDDVDGALEAMSGQLAAIAAMPLAHLTKLRIVHPGSVYGLCDRGCGLWSVYGCLSEQDDVFFPKLGLRLVLNRGDL